MLPFPRPQPPQSNRVDPAVFGKMFDTINPAMRAALTQAVNHYRPHAADFRRLAQEPPSRPGDDAILRRAADFAHACVQITMLADAETLFEELRRAGTLDHIAVPLRG